MVDHLQHSWAQWETASEDRLSPDARWLVIGDACADFSAATPEAAVVAVSPVEARLLAELPPALVVLGCSSLSLRSLTIARPEGAITCGDAVIQGLLSATRVTFVVPADGTPSRSSLTPGSAGDWNRWRSSLWQRFVEHFGLNDRVTRTALEAGLRLIHDDLDGSHRCSQSIEGAGPAHTGDYWHAMMHRREPDYGNSKYWFRQVGNHPIFPQLCEEWLSLGTAPDLAPRVTAAAQSGRWNPAAFVDASESAERGTATLIRTLEEMQYRELLQLLAWSWTTFVPPHSTI